jgi:hypothetical protein
MREQQLKKLVEMFATDGGKSSRPDRSRGDDAEYYVTFPSNGPNPKNDIRALSKRITFIISYCFR